MTVLADRYRLADLLGRGGVADVYRARDLVLDRDVAVKVLRETVDDNERSRFLGEARMLARLSHVGLVTVLDTGVWGRQPFLVMELVEGSTLAATLREGPLPLDRVAEIGAQLAAVIAYAHEMDVVHRDVKPANVLLGPGGDLKLADFGIARLVGDMVRHTQTGTTVGTPAYVSPEQARGAPVGPPTDVYSLGLVLLETITGDRAFTGTPIESALARLHRGPTIPEDLPADWRELIGAMTAMDPGDRPTAAEVAARIPASSAQPGATRVLAPVPGMLANDADVVPTERIDAAPSATRGHPLKLVAVVVASALAVVVLAVTGAVLGDGDGAPDDAPDPSTTSPATTADTELEEQATATATGEEQDEPDPPAEDEQRGKGKGKQDKDKGNDDKGNDDKGKDGKGKGGKGKG